MYCNKQDLIATFGALEIARLTEQDSEIDKAINDADAEIDMYLCNRYQLPMPSVPPVLNRIACDIARYYLYISVDEESTVYLRYQQRLKQLQQIANGKLSLLFGEAGDEQEGARDRPAEEQVVFIETGSKVFGR